MKWIILVLVAIGGLALFVNRQTLPNFLPFGSRQNSQALPLTSSPPEAIRTLADRILLPLESEKIVTTESAQKALAHLHTQITSTQHPDPRLEQALTLLNQALKERDAAIQRIMGGGTHTRLDKVPGDWRSVDDRSQKIDLSGNNTRRRNSFWANAELKKWHQRSTEYRTAIDSLLAPGQRPQ